jgi:ADP-ribose pyrophosphatase
VVSVRSDVVRSPVDDSRFTRDVVTHPGAVAVVALDDDGRVLLVSQYRHPVGHRLVELPAGLRDVHGEDPRDTAERELYEEGHLRASDWRVLVDTFSSPGMTEEAIRIFLARGLTEVPHPERFQGEHEEADMQLTWAPVEAVVAAILDGSVHNAVLCTGVLAAWAVQHGHGFEALRGEHAPWPGGGWPLAASDKP